MSITEPSWNCCLLPNTWQNPNPRNTSRAQPLFISTDMFLTLHQDSQNSQISNHFCSLFLKLDLAQANPIMSLEMFSSWITTETSGTWSSQGMFLQFEQSSWVACRLFRHQGLHSHGPPFFSFMHMYDFLGKAYSLIHRSLGNSVLKF